MNPLIILCSLIAVAYGVAVPTTPAACLDKYNTCFDSIWFCHDPRYEPQLRKDCPVTCKFCDGSSNTTPPSCRDVEADCQSLKSKCGDPRYKPSMEQKCAKTCQFC